ncbi:MAG: SDR family oxidoreductase [Acidimicrobiia bacterium]|nr:SDR family oxidoreductase [Acidimicrobiia bacterium]
MTFASETWVVTGASRGVGAAIADGLWARGARLVLNARKAAALQAKADELGDPDRVRVVAGDIGSAETAVHIAAAAVELGGPFGVIHNAAVAGAGPMIWETTAGESAAILGASLDGGLHLVRAMMPAMLEQGEGCFVFVGSGIAERNLIGVGSYGIAKAGEEYLARQLAVEAPGLASFVWRPGVVDTDMQTEARLAPTEVSKVFKSFQDDGMLVSPAEAAADLLRHLSGSRSALSGTMVSVPRKG